ncbi:hypothetical protein ACLK1T_27370 [Escherichia coli]
MTILRRQDESQLFSAQSLGWLGAAINPLVSGVVLTSLPPSSLFIILALVMIAAWVLMLKGIRAKPWGTPRFCRFKSNTIKI